MSGVEFIVPKDLIACGLNGIDYSRDGGKNWTKIASQGFHVVKIARIGNSIYLAGNKGTVGKLVFRN
jgi:hypothetical protein